MILLLVGGNVEELEAGSMEGAAARSLRAPSSKDDNIRAQHKLNVQEMPPIA